MERKPRDYSKLMDDIFGPWEYHIFENLQKADSMIAKAGIEAGCFGVPVQERQAYIREKLVDMIDQIAEQRERKRGDAV